MEVLGHRGSAGRPGRAENGIAAVAAGLAAGADGVEVDVRRTADGVLVCSHDPDLGRVTGLGPGAGPVVAATPYRALRALVLPGGGGVARLDEVLDVAAARGAAVVAEVKPVAGPARLGVARAVVALLAARRRLRPGADRVTCSSFDPLAAAVLGTGGRAGLLVEPRAHAARLVDRAAYLGVAEVHLPVAALRREPGLVARAGARGLRVVAWTVDDPADLARCRRLGVAAVISDDPGAARAVLRPVAALTPRRAAPAAPTSA